jgi:hypothetical protein
MMAVLTTKRRQALKPGAFALPGKGEGKGGKGAGSYPIPDPAHARNALARVSQFGSPGEKATVRRKVAEKFPGIGQANKKANKTSKNSSGAKSNNKNSSGGNNKRIAGELSRRLEQRGR